MADELTLNLSLAFSKGSVVAELKAGALTFDVTGTACIHNVQSVGTSAETLQLGDVGVGGYLLAVNRDATNFIELRPDAAVADLVRLEPGDWCCFRVTDDVTPYAIADTSACDLEYLLVAA